MVEVLVVIDMEVEVSRGTTVMVEDEVMAMLNLHLLQRRAPTAIPIGSTSSSLAALSDKSLHVSQRHRDACVGKGRRAVDCYRSRRRS
jgi:hypothetical protein